MSNIDRAFVLNADAFRSRAAMQEFHSVIIGELSVPGAADNVEPLNSKGVNSAGVAEALNSVEVSYILEGEYVKAIKEVRSRTGLGLKEAKNSVDLFRASIRGLGNNA